MREGAGLARDQRGTSAGPARGHAGPCRAGAGPARDQTGLARGFWPVRGPIRANAGWCGIGAGPGAGMWCEWGTSRDRRGIWRGIPRDMARDRRGIFGCGAGPRRMVRGTRIEWCVEHTSFFMVKRNQLSSSTCPSSRHLVATRACRPRSLPRSPSLGSQGRTPRSSYVCPNAHTTTNACTRTHP